MFYEQCTPQIRDHVIARVGQIRSVSNACRMAGDRAVAKEMQSLRDQLKAEKRAVDDMFRNKIKAGADLGLSDVPTDGRDDTITAAATQHRSLMLSIMAWLQQMLLWLRNLFTLQRHRSTA